MNNYTNNSDENTIFLILNLYLSLSLSLSVSLSASLCVSRSILGRAQALSRQRNFQINLSRVSRNSLFWLSLSQSFSFSSDSSILSFFMGYALFHAIILKFDAFNLCVPK